MTTTSIFWPKEQRLFRETILVAMGVFLLALSAQFVIPFKPVPLTFQSACVILLGMTYGKRLSGLTVISYLLLGALGLPLFAHFSSGLNIGPTTGYLLGFLPAAFLGGWLAEKGFAKNSLRAFLAALLSASIIFIFGISFLANWVGFHQAIILGLMPFIVTEPLKLLAVALIVPRCWKMIE